MRVYAGANKQLAGEDGSFNMKGRNFMVFLLPANATTFDRDQKTTKQVIAGQEIDGLKLDPEKSVAVYGDNRAKTGEPDTVQILFLVQDRNSFGKKVQEHAGGGLLVELAPDENPALNAAEPATYEERVGSASVGAAGRALNAEGEPVDEDGKLVAKTQTKAAPKAAKRSGSGAPEDGAAIALLSGNDLIVLGNGEGLLFTIPQASLV